MVVLTGDQLVVSTLSRTKEAVDHAGLSLVPLVQNSLTGSKPKIFSIYLSSNLSTAIQLPKAAVEDGTSGLGTISRKALRWKQLSTHTPVKPETAKMDLVKSVS